MYNNDNLENEIKQDKVADELDLINSKILQLYELCGNCVFIEYYTHSNANVYKILNPFTKYSECKIALYPVSEGILKSIDAAIDYITKAKNEYFNK